MTNNLERIIFSALIALFAAAGVFCVVVCVWVFVNVITTGWAG